MMGKRTSEVDRLYAASEPTCFIHLVSPSEPIRANKLYASSELI